MNSLICFITDKGYPFSCGDDIVNINIKDCKGCYYEARHNEYLKEVNINLKKQGKSFKCRVCGGTEYDRISMNSAFKSCSGTVPQYYQCRECSVLFKDKDLFSIGNINMNKQDYADFRNKYCKSCLTILCEETREKIDECIMSMTEVEQYVDNNEVTTEKTSFKHEGLPLSEQFECVAPNTYDCKGQCFKSYILRNIGTDTYICPYFKYKKGD